MRNLVSYLTQQHRPFNVGAMQYPVQPHADEIARRFMKAFTIHDDSEYGYTFRSSAVGRHPFLLCWEHFNHDASNTITLGTRFKFLTGYLFEAFFSLLLTELEMKYESQRTISYQLNDMSIGGHPDFIITDDVGETWVLETKCVNEKIYNEYAKAGEVTRLEYQMQLAMYCLRIKAHGCFVVCNLTNGHMSAYPMRYEQIVQKYKEKVVVALSTLHFIHNCKEWYETLERIPAPSPLKRKDGTYYLPPYMYRSKGVLHSAAVVYDHSVIDEKVFVTGYNYPAIAKHLEPKLQ